MFRHFYAIFRGDISQVTFKKLPVCLYCQCAFSSSNRDVLSEKCTVWTASKTVRNLFQNIHESVFQITCHCSHIILKYVISRYLTKIFHKLNN
jgi:hypothetical protein